MKISPTTNNTQTHNTQMARKDLRQSKCSKQNLCSSKYSFISLRKTYFSMLTVSSKTQPVKPKNFQKNVVLANMNQSHVREDKQHSNKKT